MYSNVPWWYIHVVHTEGTMVHTIGTCMYAHMTYILHMHRTCHVCMYLLYMYYMLECVLKSMDNTCKYFIKFKLQYSTVHV